MDRKELKKQNITQFITGIAIVVLVCYISSFAFFRLDLTQEKRYTLSNISKQKLLSLTDEVVVKVYLYGDMPQGFKKLSQSVNEMLDEFRVYAKNNIQYEFIDAYADSKSTKAIVEELYKKGIQPVKVKIKDNNGGYSEKMILPAALVSFGGIELAVNLLSNNQGLTGEENLNNSVQALEYALINAIHTVTNTKIEKIAFLEGHGELDQYQVGDITRELANYYQVDRGSIIGNVQALDKYKCIIIAKPQTPFSEEDKFVLDQYIMNGGKVLWLVDAVTVDADSMAKGQTMATIQNLNIDDQLFRYGVRINPVLVQDVQAALLPINSANQGGQPKFTPAPWYYYPMLSGSAFNPVSRNLALVKAEFCNFIDTLEEPHTATKSVLLATSKMSRLCNVPNMISLAEIKQQHSRADFSQSFLPVAVILEGTFPSVFKNRMLSGLKLNSKYEFKDASKPTKLMVVADGDIIRNNVRQSPQGILISPLGTDKYTSQVYGNKAFILNAVNYLTDETGLMNLRTREVKLRLLDKQYLADNLLIWQIINVLVPVLLVILIGFGIQLYRKKIYHA